MSPIKLFLTDGAFKNFHCRLMVVCMKVVDAGSFESKFNKSLSFLAVLAVISVVFAG
jgi:hypothetical protein